MGEQRSFKVGDVVAWADVPDGALVMRVRNARRNFHYRASADAGWYVGGGPLLTGHDMFNGIPPKGNLWPRWCAWEKNGKATIVALGLSGTESADTLKALVASAT